VNRQHRILPHLHEKISHKCNYQQFDIFYSSYFIYTFQRVLLQHKCTWHLWDLNRCHSAPCHLRLGTQDEISTEILSYLRATASRTRVDNQRWRRKKSTHIATAVRSILPTRADTYLSSGQIYELFPWPWPWSRVTPKSPCAASNSLSWASLTEATLVFSHRPSVVTAVVDWQPAIAIREAMVAISSPFSFHQQFWTCNNKNAIFHLYLNFWRQLIYS